MSENFKIFKILNFAVQFSNKSTIFGLDCKKNYVLRNLNIPWVNQMKCEVPSVPPFSNLCRIKKLPILKLHLFWTPFRYCSLIFHLLIVRGL